MKPLHAAIFLFLSIFFNLSAFGGEWHSAGNAPVWPHKPKSPVNYKCTLTGYTEVGKKQYRFIVEKEFSDADFQGDWPVARLAFEKTGDPGMDGHVADLRFRNNFDGSETLELNLSVKIPGRATAFSQFTAPRAAKSIGGTSYVVAAKPYVKKIKFVRVLANCKDLNP